MMIYGLLCEGFLAEQGAGDSAHTLGRIPRWFTETPASL